MRIPDVNSSTFHLLGLVPQGVDAAVILRHAKREDIPRGTFGTDVGLTLQGIRDSRRLGTMLSARSSQGTITSSPVRRCIATAEEIWCGSGWSAKVLADRRLGDPGPFVIDPEVAGEVFLNTGISEIVRRQLTCCEPPQGMRETSRGVEILLSLAAGGLAQRGRVQLYVTHDAILAVLVAHLYRLSVEETGWPDFLDGLVLWRSSDRIHFAWKGLTQGSYPVGG